MRLGPEMGLFELHIYKCVRFPWMTVQGYINGGRRFWI
jgi:hypothetical protein